MSSGRSKYYVHIVIFCTRVNKPLKRRVLFLNSTRRGQAYTSLFRFEQIELPTSNIERRTSNNDVALLHDIISIVLINPMFRHHSFHSTFDVGRSMFDVIFFGEPQWPPQRNA